MPDVRVSGPQAVAVSVPRRRLLDREGIGWLILVSAAFLAAELTPALTRLPLGADEITYIARTSVQASGVMLPPVHGQGAGLLAAPVTLVTGSLAALRVWMSVLSAVGLFLALLCWRGLRPAWVLALAGLILASLAITQDSGVQVYPDWWGALGLLALTGLFLHAVAGTMRDRLVLPLIGLASLVIVVMRPQNIVFLMGPAILAAVVVPGWRRLRVLAAMAAGIALGCLQWVIGAYVWYGGLASRIHLAGQEPPALRLYFSLGTQARVLSGPWYCVPPAGCRGWDLPGESAWWALFLAAAVLGLWISRGTAARASAVFAACSAVWVVALYTFLVPFGAPRYLLPSLALMSLLAADAVAWLVGRRTRVRRRGGSVAADLGAPRVPPRPVPGAPWRRTGIAVACLFVLSGVISQRFVLQHLAASERSTRPFQQEAAQLSREGIRPPCAMGSPFVAYYLGCAGPWTGQSMSQLLSQTPQGSHGWREIRTSDGTLVFVPRARPGP